MTPILISPSVRSLTWLLIAAFVVASVPAPPDALALVEFVFGSGAAATVHGLPAVVLTSRTGDWQAAFDGRNRVIEALFGLMGTGTL